MALDKPSPRSSTLDEASLKVYRIFFLQQLITCADLPNPSNESELTYSFDCTEIFQDKFASLSSNIRSGKNHGILLKYLGHKFNPRNF